MLIREDFRMFSPEYYSIKITGYTQRGIQKTREPKTNTNLKIGYDQWGQAGNGKNGKMAGIKPELKPQNILCIHFIGSPVE